MESFDLRGLGMVVERRVDRFQPVWETEKSVWRVALGWLWWRLALANSLKEGLWASPPPVIGLPIGRLLKAG
ncbi:MAG: hypothetical protein R6V73_10665 [Anaerolineales bacterium]